MKKIILTISISFCSLFYSQKTISTYSMGFFPGEKYEIQTGDPAEKDSKFYIDAETRDKIVKKISIIVPFGDIDYLKTSLEKCKDVYINWKKTAIENKVTELDKPIDVKFLNYDVAFLYGSKWNIDFSTQMSARFKIVNGKYLFILSNDDDLTASSNRYMTTKGFYIVLNSEDEINSFINSLSKEKSIEIYSAKNKTEELFK